MPNAAASISRAVKVAHRAGTLVVLTAGDAGLVQRKRPQLLEALRLGADVLFTNRCGTLAQQGQLHVTQVAAAPCVDATIAQLRCLRSRWSSTGR